MAQWPIPSDLHARITSGPLCPVLDHSHGSIDGQIPRYDDSHACVRCIAGLTEGRLDLSIKRIHPQFRRRFLEFWSLVEITSPTDCWSWQGPTHTKTKTTYFPFPRFWGKGRNYAAPRVATWLTWGDVGRLPIKHVCGNRFCCNPLHLRVAGVQHFYCNKHLASIDLVSSCMRLNDATQEFIEIIRDQAPGRYRRLEKMSTDWIRARAESAGPLMEGP